MPSYLERYKRPSIPLGTPRYLPLLANLTMPFIGVLPACPAFTPGQGSCPGHPLNHTHEHLTVSQTAVSTVPRSCLTLKLHINLVDMSPSIRSFDPPFEGLRHVVKMPKLLPSMSSILLVDDHPVMRALLRQVLEAYPDIVIVAEAEDGEEAVKLATRLHPDVAVIDLHLPRVSGVEATKLIRLQSPCTAIIGLTAGEPDDRELEIISAGASAILNKADVYRELHPSIVRAVRLASFYPARLNQAPRPSSDCNAAS